jgi:hypothetical protein
MDTDLSGDEGDMADMGDEDEFGAAEPATGGEETAGRAKRESRQYKANKLHSKKK